MGVKADGAHGYKESFVVHFMPMRQGARGMRWDDELGGTEAVVYIRKDRILVRGGWGKLGTLREQNKEETHQSGSHPP